MSQYPNDPRYSYPNQPGAPQQGQGNPTQGYGYPGQPPGGQGYPGQVNPGPYQPAYYTPYSRYGSAGPPTQSGLGVASFIIGLISVLAVGVTMTYIMSLVLKSPTRNVDNQSPEVMAVGCAILLAAGLSVVGLILAIVSVMQRDRKKAFGVLGLIFNGGLLLAVVVLMVVGLASK